MPHSSNIMIIAIIHCVGTTARECIFIDSRSCIHYYFTIGVGAIHAENTECKYLRKFCIVYTRIP